MTPAPLPLYQRPGFLLRRAHQISVGIFEEQCRPLGLTPPQYGALVLIDASPGSDQSSLARAMGFDKVTTLRLVRGLEEREYVHRALSTRDRRQHQLTLTAKVMPMPLSRHMVLKVDSACSIITLSVSSSSSRSGGRPVSSASSSCGATECPCATSPWWSDAVWQPSADGWPGWACPA